MPWYAVANGRVNGVYTTAELCDESIDNFDNPISQEFSSQFLAEEWLRAGGLQHPPVFVSSPFPKFLGLHPRDMGRTTTMYHTFLHSNQLEFLWFLNFYLSRNGFNALQVPGIVDI